MKLTRIFLHGLVFHTYHNGGEESPCSHEIPCDEQWGCRQSFCEKAPWKDTISRRKWYTIFEFGRVLLQRIQWLLLVPALGPLFLV